jgi:hypothetical protein
VMGSWPFPPLSETFGVSGSDSAGPSAWIHVEGAKRFSTVLPRRLVPVRAVRMVGSPREPAFHRTPLMGFVKDAPPPTSQDESTPERAVARSSVRCVPSRALVPSLPFHPTPTVSSSSCLAGLLHPAASHGVRRVSMFAGETRGPTRRMRIISSTAHTLRSFSLTCSRTASSRPVPSRCLTGFADSLCRSTRTTDSLLNLKVLLHRRSRCERSAVASRVLHVASMGFSFRDALWPDPPLQRATDAGSRANPGPGLLVHPRADPRADSHRRRWCQSTPQSEAGDSNS